MKEYILKKIKEKASNDIQMLEDLVRQIIHEEKLKKDDREEPQVKTRAIQLSKRKIKG
jgi:hypothetical protein